MAAHPWNIVCPTCHAKKGMPCVDLLWGYAMPTYHEARKGR